jgi:CBS-domain-containing membrane protein
MDNGLALVSEYFRTIPASLNLLLRPLVTIQSVEATIPSFHKLCDHSITSAPVVDAENRFIGFLDIRDLMQLLIYQVDQRDAASIAARGLRNSIDSGKDASRNSFLQVALYGAATMHKNPISGVTVACSLIFEFQISSCM